jgi:hypothetical protein
MRKRFLHDPVLPDADRVPKLAATTRGVVGVPCAMSHDGGPRSSGMVTKGTILPASGFVVTGRQTPV